jgi:hypothetical protein
MTVDLNICKMGKKNGLRIISNAEQCSSEFYIQFAEENINIALSQIRVYKTNPENNFLINNDGRKQYEKNKKMTVYVRETSPPNHNTRIWKSNILIFIQHHFSLLSSLQNRKYVSGLSSYLVPPGRTLLPGRTLSPFFTSAYIDQNLFLPPPLES